MAVGVIYLPNLAGQLRYRVRELERERVTVQEAARQLGITESAVRKRAQRGQLRSEKATEGKKERLYIFLDPDEDKFPETFRDRYITSLEQRVNSLEDEVYRQQAILLNMTEAMKALSPPSQETPPNERESPQTVEEERERAEPHSATEGDQEGTGRPQQRSSWLGPADKLPWWQYLLGVLVVLIINFFAPIMIHYAASVLGRYGLTRVAVIAIVVLAWAPSGFFGLWVGLKRRHAGGSGRSWTQTISRGLVIGIGSTLGLFGGWILKGELIGAWQRFSNPLDDVWPLLSFFLGTTILYVSGELIGNARQRLRAEKVYGERSARSAPDNAWSPRSQAMWGFAGTIIGAMIGLGGNVITTVWGG